MDINEFINHLGDVQRDYPLEAEKALRRGSNKMLRAVRSASPDSGQKHKRKIKNSWRCKLSGLRAEDIQANIYSIAPHFHLVERGHVMKTLGGKVKGYKQGTHFFEKTVNSNINEIQELISDDLFKAVCNKL